MKRILAIALTLVMVHAALAGCMASQNPSGKEGEQNPSGNEGEPSTSENTDKSVITLTIKESHPYAQAFGHYDNNYCFYANDDEGRFFRVWWSNFEGLAEKDRVVVEYHNFKELVYEDGKPDGGFTPDYEITAISVKKENTVDENLVSHIQINSGANTIHPFGCMTWSKIDNGNGTFTESIVDKYDVVDLVSGKSHLSVTDIPKLVLDESVSYSVQVNGQVEKVYLLTPNGNEYTKTESTFDALSNLSDGTYYVVLEVLLSGNCDPDAPQHSYRYEDVFCLVVDNKDTNHFIEFSFEDDKVVFPSGTPGVQSHGFNNVTESPINTYTDAIERAKNECTIDWNEIQVYYDTDTGIWKVMFYTKEFPGGDQSVYFGTNGKTFMIVYGE